MDLLCSVFVFVILFCLFLAAGHLLGNGCPLGSLVCSVNVTFPYDVLGQVWYLIVSIPDLRLLSYFDTSCGVPLLLEGGPYQCFKKHEATCDFPGAVGFGPLSPLYIPASAALVYLSELACFQYNLAVKSKK